MRFSRIGVLVLITVTLLVGSSCSYYNRIVARKNLVDGSKAFKDRKFDLAEELFRKAIARDPNGENVEGRTAQVFLARTLHSKYVGDRKRTDLAEQAIAEYHKALQMDPTDQTSYKAIASLYENLQRPDDWQKWVTARANNNDIPPQFRAEALTSLAAKKNTCANDITDTDKTKKTVTRDGKPAFQFVKPQDPAEFEQLKKCIQEGMELIEKAIALEPAEVKNARSIDVKALSDTDLKKTQDLLKIFESARSYRASLLMQAMREAEMDGKTAERDRLKSEADAAREKFTELSDIVKKIQMEMDERQAAKDANVKKPESGN